MSRIISCTQCNGVMVLEDRGEMLDSVDVMTLFGYRCLNCGHAEPVAHGSGSTDKRSRFSFELEVQHI